MTIPECIVIVPDGNRRDEAARTRPKLAADLRRTKLHIAKAGHARGLANCRKLVEAAFELGVKHVVVWAASESNLRNRDANEIAFLYRLLKGELRYRLRRESEGYGFRLCGLWNIFGNDPELRQLVEETQARTSVHTEQVLTLLFGYDGLTELAHAARKAVAEGAAITPETLRRYCWTSHLPDVKLGIRTGVDADPKVSDSAFIEGDIHQSDLLLPCQSKNMHWCYSPVRWPSFTVEHLKRAFAIYQNRQSRCGA